MSSSELYLLYSLRGSPVPLGGRLELLSLGGVLDAAVVEWALEEAGPGLAFAPLVGEVGLAPTWGGNPPPATVAAMGAGMVGGREVRLPLACFKALCSVGSV